MAAIVSISQPNTVFVVDQVASPLSIFLIEAGSCRCGLSCGPNGRNTSSRA